MNILVFNCGSSSLTFKVYMVSAKTEIAVLLSGKAHRVGVKGTEPSFIEFTSQGNTEKIISPLKNHRAAAASTLKYIKDHEISLDYIGHRFVHGGSFFHSSTFLDEKTLHTLKLCEPLAPLHNPISLNVIDESKKYFPTLKQYVAFDSAFHATLPSYAYTYALPKTLIQKFGFRKYGFHGLSNSFVINEASRYLEKPLRNLKMIVCHLGTGGSSVTAIKDGHSVDTSMGYSPLPGLVMSTRSGDIDPMLAIYLMEVFGY